MGGANSRRHDEYERSYEVREQHTPPYGPTPTRGGPQQQPPQQQFPQQPMHGPPQHPSQQQPQQQYSQQQYPQQQQHYGGMSKTQLRKRERQARHGGSPKWQTVEHRTETEVVPAERAELARQIRPVSRDVVYEIHPSGGTRETGDTSFLRPVFKPMTPDELRAEVARLKDRLHGEERTANERVADIEARIEAEQSRILQLREQSYRRRLEEERLSDEQENFRRRRLDLHNRRQNLLECISAMERELERERAEFEKEVRDEAQKRERVRLDQVLVSEREIEKYRPQISSELDRFRKQEADTKKDVERITREKERVDKELAEARLRMNNLTGRLHDLAEKHARATEDEKRLKAEEAAVRREMEHLPPEYTSRLEKRFTPLEETIREQRQAVDDITRLEHALAQAEEKARKDMEEQKKKMKEDEEAANQERARMAAALRERARAVEQTPSICKIIATESAKPKQPVSSQEVPIGGAGQGGVKKERVEERTVTKETEVQSKVPPQQQQQQQQVHA